MTRSFTFLSLALSLVAVAPARGEEPIVFTPDSDQVTIKIHALFFYEHKEFAYRLLSESTRPVLIWHNSEKFSKFADE